MNRNIFEAAGESAANGCCTESLTSVRSDGRKKIIQTLQQAGQTHGLFRVFSDWVAIMACSLSVLTDPFRQEYRLRRGRETAARYTREEIGTMVQMMDVLAMELASGPDDVLGTVFSELGLHDVRKGQFFTPYALAKGCARMVLNEQVVRAQVDSAGYFRVADPCAGAGALGIACAEIMDEWNFDHREHLHVLATDVDELAAHMAYIQFSLLGIPALVVLGNSITRDSNDVWRTPGHVVGDWDRKK